MSDPVLKHLTALLLWLSASLAHAAGPAPFDLAGPSLVVSVTRGERTLPIAQVPNLAEGDQLRVKAALPATQSARYLMVLAFLSGSTNPPPKNWFHPCKTWKKKCQDEGLTVTVPAGAQQVLLFLAPATGGDFDTLVSTVQGRPGAFVRSTQDLNQAALDRSRLQRYLSTIRTLDQTDPARLKTAAPLLARSLAIRVDEKCLDRLPQLQAPCLMSEQESLILSDGHSLSLAEAFASSPGYDLLRDVSATPEAGYGFYSPYINSVVDLARILGSFNTARYQYIPALGAAQGSEIALTLNTAPSFQAPRSVLVAALPAVEAPQLPPLHAVTPEEIHCASQSRLVLPVEGAPLVFATDFAHDLKLTLTGSEGQVIELPAEPDGMQGGYVIDTTRLQGVPLGETVRGVLQGHWGFAPYTGPGFQLRNTQAKQWTLAPSEGEGLLVGRTETVHLKADSVSCVDNILLRDPAGKELRAEWRRTHPGEVEVKLPLQEVRPGPLTLLIAQHGGREAVPVALQAFVNVGRLDGFTLHAGDAEGVLKGTRLDEVTQLVVAGLTFLPGDLATPPGGDTLRLHAQDTAAASALPAGRALTASVSLRDGRVMKLAATITAARPRLALIAKSATAIDSRLQLASEDLLPLTATLRFSVRAEVPPSFAREQAIEIATVDEAFSTTLTLANGGLRREDSRIAVATLDPAKAFGASAFGPLRFRALVNGLVGDWQALTTLVRLPVVERVECPPNVELACKLSGSDLFLISAVASSAAFESAALVPDGFPASTLSVPRPVDGLLYVKLRDAPAVAHPLRVSEAPALAVRANADPALSIHKLTCS